MAYSLIERGSKYSLDYRAFFRTEHVPISALHDIPLCVNNETNIYNMVVEIPRWTNAVMEISIEEYLNPIKQVIENDKPKFVPNCFPHHGYLWNYGTFPQTWENPGKDIPPFLYKGDNDPLDVIEIGEKVAKMGEVVQVKVLGAIALLDKSAAADYKIIAINKKDPLANKFSNVVDVTEQCPMLMEETIKWFKNCEVPNGKPQNQIAFDERFISTFVTHSIIDTCHRDWRALFGKPNSARNFSYLNTTLRNMYKLDHNTAHLILNQTPNYRQSSPIDPLVNKIHFV